jgi:orotate phosphoribosyltransferase
MSARMANAVGTMGVGSHISDHRENTSMLQAVKPPDVLSGKKARLLEIIRERSLLKGKFKLASGAWSDYYLDMKPTSFDPEGANLIADIVYDMLGDTRDIDAIGGLELGSVPIVIGVAMRSWGSRPMRGFVVRKEKKGHGTDKLIDGNFQPNTAVALFEDVTTKGDSVMQAVRAVRAKGGTVKTIVTLVDRLEGAAENLKREGIALQAIYTAPELLG